MTLFQNSVFYNYLEDQDNNTSQIDNCNNWENRLFDGLSEENTTMLEGNE